MIKSEDLKIRTFPKANYKSIYVNGKTLRIALDPSKPIGELEYPEFYDVKITDKCNGGCPYCYQNSLSFNKHFDNIIEKIDDFFGSMDANQRPFQVAIGGGEPTLHPDFISICKKFRSLGIAPNYTTNGMHLTEEILDATKKYCEGVAVTCHAHLEPYWRDAVAKLLSKGIFTNLHVLLHNDASVLAFRQIYEEFRGRIKYFVLLPLIEQGRAKESFNSFDLLKETLNDIKEKYGNIENIAMGAMFYELLKQHNPWGFDVYEPEILSKYLDMSDMKLYKSSFHVN